MTDAVRDSYNFWAEKYTELALGDYSDLERVSSLPKWLQTFADQVAPGGGLVADLGCGPGHITNHLSGLGLTVRGYDLSSAMVAEAERAFPDSNFQVGDMTALDLADSSLAGIFARHSVIHMQPSGLAAVFGEWARVLKPGAPALVSFFAAATAERHGAPFDHKVATAYELFPDTIVSELERVGFSIVQMGTREPLPGERPLDHGTVLARRALPKVKA